MKTTTSRFVGAVAALFMIANVARPGAALLGEELAVIQAMAAIVNRDASRSFDFLYFETDFPASPYVVSSIENPDRRQFCGLSRDQALAVVRQLVDLTAESVEIDKGVARTAGLSIGHKRLERFRYLTLSRVVFAPGGQRAWVAVDQNGETGAVYRLDKTGGEWSTAARCGGWVKTE